MKIQKIDDSCKRIGFIGSSETVVLQNDIWVIELYKKDTLDDTKYFLVITDDAEEEFIFEFEDVNDSTKEVDV